jgi:hypothetical protein
MILAKLFVAWAGVRVLTAPRYTSTYRRKAEKRSVKDWKQKYKNKNSLKEKEKYKKLRKK